MRHPRPAAFVLLTVLALTACTSTAPGWTYAPAPSATPAPSSSGSAAPSSSVAPSASTGPSASASVVPSASASVGPSASVAPSASASASVAPSASASAGAATVTITASGIAFTTAAVTAPATGFTLSFDNEDAGTPHDVQIKDGSGTQVFETDIVTGVATKTYDVPALAAGAYTFACTIHSNMTGTLTVQ
jgi:plastocyanin